MKAYDIPGNNTYKVVKPTDKADYLLIYTQ